MKLFKIILPLLFSVVTAFANNNKDNVDGEAFTITGDLTSYYTEGTIKIVGYSKKASTGGGGMMMAMGSSSPNEVVYAEGPVTKGKFKISGKISDPQSVHIRGAHMLPRAALRRNRGHQSPQPVSHSIRHVLDDISLPRSLSEQSLQSEHRESSLCAYSAAGYSTMLLST